MINLSLPLSATALREGAEFLLKLSSLAEVIRDEANPQSEFLQHPNGAIRASGVTSVNLCSDPTAAITTEQDPETGEITIVAETTLADDVATAEAAAVTQYETVVTGYERDPDYTGANAAYDQEALTAAGWSVEQLVADGYLIEVTEQVPLAPAPTAAPAPPGPAASAPPAPATTGVELDADGLPWDSRIHSDATVRKAATGKWKTRKNLAAGFKEQIEAELRAVMAASPSTATTASASAPAPSPAAPPAPAAAPPAPVAAAAPAAPGTMTFADFTRYLVLNKVDAGKVMVQVQKQGLTSIPDLAKRPDLIPAVLEGLKG